MNSISTTIASLFVSVALCTSAFGQRVADESWMTFGGRIGTHGIHFVEQGGVQELIVGSDNSVWSSYRRDPKTGDYVCVYASPEYLPVIGQIQVVDLDRDGKQEVLVSQANLIHVYDFASKRKRGEIKLGSLSGSFEAYDVIPGGSLEIVVGGQSHLSVFALDGSLLRSFSATNLYRLRVGQMDDDPALEVTSRRGQVYDLDTGQIEFDRFSLQHQHIELADADQDGKLELLIAQSDGLIHCFDVDLDQEAWTIPCGTSVDAMRAIDVEGDSTPELILAGASAAVVTCYDLQTRSLLWDFFEWGTSASAFELADWDRDGELELIWSSNVSGGDTLRITDYRTGLDEWNSERNSGPFIGPVMGDLDGDGRFEFVVASSQSGNDSGRLLVFDARTLRLRASSPFLSSNASYETLSLEIADPDGDGRDQVFVGTDASQSFGNHRIEEWHLDSGDAFSPGWVNQSAPDDLKPTSLLVTDLHGNGSSDVVMGGGRSTSSSSWGAAVFVFDGQSGLETMRSVRLGASNSSRVTQLSRADLDRDGIEELIARVENESIFILDPSSLEVLASIPGSWTSMLSYAHGPNGRVTLYAGDRYGFLRAYRATSRGMQEVFEVPIAFEPIDAVHLDPNHGLVAAIGGRMHFFSIPQLSVTGVSEDYGDQIGTDLIWLPRRRAMISLGKWGWHAFVRE
jgi:hypothetical protein